MTGPRRIRPATASPKVVFLDAHDRLLPELLAAGVACQARTEPFALIYGGHR